MNKWALFGVVAQGIFFAFFVIAFAVNVASGRLFWSLWDLLFVVVAQANQKVAKAKGEAESTLIQARADANSQRLKQRTLTPLLVQMAAIDKLNPHVQVIVCNQGQQCVPNAVLSTASGK